MKIKNLLLLVTGAAILLSSCGQKMTGNVKLDSDLDSISYCMGADIGGNLKTSTMEEVNYDALLNGLIDGFEEKDLKIEKEKIQPYIQKFFQELKTKKFEQNLKDGEAFLEENKKREGVITTESGLQYEIITEGTGESPSETDLVNCHYHGTFIDGSIFDSSVDRGTPANFVLNQVIPGWTEGLQLMKEGAKYKFYIPSNLAYGERGNRKVEPNLALIFEVELIEVKDSPEQKAN